MAKTARIAATALVAALGLLAGTIFLKHVGLLGPAVAATRWNLAVDAFADVRADGQLIGPSDAPVLAVVFSNYGCGFSRSLDTTLATLRRKYPQQFAIVIKHLVTPGSPRNRVHLGAECAAEQDSFEAYHRSALSNSRAQSYWNGESVIADSARVPNLARFETCVRSEAYAHTIEGHWAEATRLGVHLSPTTFINGSRIVGAAPIEHLDSIVQRELRRADASKSRK